MNLCETIKRIILILAIIVGIAVYAAFTAAEIAAVTYLFPALIALGAAGILTLLLAAAIGGCGCERLRSAFCCAGVYAAVGGAGTVLAALITALIGADSAVAYRVGTAVAFALLTLMLGGIVGLLTKYMGCANSCRCTCNDDNASETALDSSEADCSSYRRIYGR